MPEPHCAAVLIVKINAFEYATPTVALLGKHRKSRHLRAILFQGQWQWECHGTAHMVQVQPCLSNKDINSELLRHQQPAAGALLEDGRLSNLGLASPRTPLQQIALYKRITNLSE